MSDDWGVDLPLVHAGKVRRLFDGGDGRLLMVATDAISAYDHILTPGIPDKGAILTQMSQWWFGELADIVDNHVLSTDVPACVAGRAVWCEKLTMLPVECVARGYLTGSGWLEYQQSGTVCGVPLPEGLSDGSRLPEPIFTPAAKAELGEHDENITFERVVEIVGVDVAERLRELTLQLYARAEQIARERGIILADTKVEFGTRADGTIVLADEVLTPDSSRFWDAATWQPGERLDSYDKQFVRNWLTQQSGWDRASDVPPPPLPDDVVGATRRRYTEAFRTLTGAAFEVPRSRYDAAMSRVIVDVMPKPEILDPQGKAVTGALARLGFEGLTVRQGKRFEIEVDGEVTEERLARIEEAASTLLANTVIESYEVRTEAQ